MHLVAQMAHAVLEHQVNGVRLRGLDNRYVVTPASFPPFRDSIHGAAPSPYIANVADLAVKQALLGILRETEL